MGDFARITVSGTDKLRSKLEGIKQDLRESALRSAGSAGAFVIRDAAISLAPVWTGPVSEGHPPPGTLKKSIIVKRIEELCGDYKQTYYITVRRGKAKDGVDAFYALWVEYGHYIRPRGISGRKHRKQVQDGTSTAQFVQPSPFLRPAYMSAHEAASKAIEEKLAEKLNLGNR